MIELLRLKKQQEENENKPSGHNLQQKRHLSATEKPMNDMSESRRRRGSSDTSASNGA